MISERLETRKIERSWRRAEGTILHKAIHVEGSSQDSPFKRFRAEIRYDYEVGGIRYVSEAFDPRGSTEGGEEEMRARLGVGEIGQRVTVYYDPADPGRAVLRTSAPVVWEWLAVGSLSSSFGAAFSLGLLAFARWPWPYPALAAGQTRFRPAFRDSLLLPLAGGLHWSALAAIGWTVSTAGSGAPPWAAVLTVVLTLVGLCFAGRLMRFLIQRRRFRGILLELPGSPAPREADVEWTLRDPRSRIGDPGFQLVFRCGEWESTGESSWKFREAYRCERTVPAERCPEGWRGHLRVTRSDPELFRDSRRRGHWYLRVTDGRHEALIPVPVASRSG